MEITDPTEMVGFALFLALIAPSEEQAREATELASLIAYEHELSETQCDRAKSRALQRVNAGSN